MVIIWDYGRACHPILYQYNSVMSDISRAVNKGHANMFGPNPTSGRTRQKNDPYYRYYYSKWKRCRARGQEFNLSYSEIRWLFWIARITPADIGRSRDQYCLGRFGDSGAYEIGNCRFITNAQNREESKWLDSQEHRTFVSTLHKRTKRWQHSQIKNC